MARESVFNKPDVVLGLDAARGFAPADQTSPALAAAADALVDTTTFIEPGFELFSEPVTELRIRLLGTPEPSGYQFVRPPSGALSDALAVPWPTYAFGAAPLGLAGGGIVAGIVLGIRFRHRVKAAGDTGARVLTGA